MRQKRRAFSALPALLMVCMLFVGTTKASAYEFEDIPTGNYPVVAELSCFVNAMGGVEFGKPLLKSAEVRVAEDGSKIMTLYFTKSQVNIYNVICDTFIDATPASTADSSEVKNGTIGYYDANGILNTSGISHTLSSDTALNASSEAVHYVDSITFPIKYQSSTYDLAIYINSNVMGTQFSADKYPAKLTVDWNSVVVKEDVDHAEIESAVSEGNKDAVGDLPMQSEPAAPVEIPASGEEAEPEAENASAESMDGLNIYRAEEDSPETLEADESEPDAATPQEDAAEVDADATAEFLDRAPFVLGVAGLAFVVAGVLLVKVGKGKKEP